MEDQSHRAQRKLQELLVEQGVESPSGDVEAHGGRQAHVGVYKLDGTVMVLPWISFHKSILHRPSGGEVFVELVFSTDNILVFGRGLEDFLVSLVRYHTIRDIVEQEADSDGAESAYFVSAVWVVSCGHGDSLFSYDAEDQHKLSAFLSAAKMTARPDVLEELSAGDSDDRYSLKYEGEAIAQLK